MPVLVKKRQKSGTVHMANYSIKQLEKLSGVKSHTIRIWERRYGLLEPKRTSTNIRLYDDEQLKRLLNISILNNNGHKISKISNLSVEQMKEALKNVLEKDTGVQYEEKIEGLIFAMIELDEEMFNKILHDVSEQIGFDRIVQELIYPFLFKVGIMWGMDEISPPEEHFISTLIRNKLIIAANELTLPGKNKGPEDTYVLFLPEEELHEVGLLMANYELRRQGKKVIYLGQNTPIEGVEAICRKSGAANLLTFFVKAIPANNLQEYLNRLSSKFEDKSILIAGRKELLQAASLPSNCTWLKSPEDL